MKKLENRISAVGHKHIRMMPLTFISLQASLFKRILIIAVLAFCLPLNLVRAQYLIPLDTNTNPIPYQKGSSGSDEFTKIFTFSPSTSGSGPVEIIVSGNKLYGNTLTGGSNDTGLLYKLNTDGTGFEKFDFETYYPYPWSLAISGSVIYGTTLAGGTYNKGSLFKVNTDFTGFQVLFDFNFPFTYPRYYIILSGDMIYGSATDFTVSGNSSVTFKIKTDGTGYTVLKVHDGSRSPVKLLLFNNYLYGTTFDQGTVEPAKLFKIKTDGTGYAKLHDFNSLENGKYPYGSLIVIGSTLYGTARRGGANDCGIFYEINTDGTGFKKLYSFSKENGWDVTSTLVQKGTSFYGAPGLGAANNLGTLFRINTNGSGFSKLFEFADTVNGRLTSSLVLSGDTIFGNTLYGGGTEDAGTIFRYFIGNLQDTLNYQPEVVSLSVSKTSFVTTKKNLVADYGSYVDLDTTFTVTGNTPYTHTWNVKTGNDFTVTDKLVKISGNTKFYLFVNTDLGCFYKDSVLIQVKGPTKVQDALAEKQILIYPNPNTGYFQIRIPEGYTKYSYDIYDVSGVNISNGNIDCPTEECIFNIKLANAIPGVYDIIIKKNDKSFIQRKFVISR